MKVAPQRTDHIPAGATASTFPKQRRPACFDDIKLHKLAKLIERARMIPRGPTSSPEGPMHVSLPGLIALGAVNVSHGHSWQVGLPDRWDCRELRASCQDNCAGAWYVGVFFSS